jgi:membrane fusion protein
MKEESSLFREEALNSRLNRSLGVHRLNVPLNYRVMTVFALIILSFIGCFICFAQIAANRVIRGYLDSDKGIVTVHSKSGGVLVTLEAKEGKKVKKGDLLFVLQTNEQEKTKELSYNLKERINNLHREYQLKQEHYHAMSQLHHKHYIATVELKNTEAQLLHISNQIKALDLEHIKYQQSQYQLIKAPIDGRITNVLYQQSQTIGANKAMLHIIPIHSQLIARLYAPSQDMGFLKKEDLVFIHYDAYPVQRFGSYKAVVKEINRTVLVDDQEEKPIKVGQPYYKVTAALDTPFITAYGKKTRLNHGMTFMAVIPGEKKKIWQWILDPLYSYFGNSFS